MQLASIPHRSKFAVDPGGQVVTETSPPNNNDNGARIARLTDLMGQLTQVVTQFREELQAARRPVVQPNAARSKRVRMLIPFALEDLGVVNADNLRPVEVQMSTGNEVTEDGTILRVASETLAYAQLRDGKRIPLTIDGISGATPFAAFDSTLVGTDVRVTWDTEQQRVLEFELGSGSFGGKIP